MADIDFKNITNATTIDDGTGYFDVLMNVINIHINDQFTKDRITGPEYANVYLGAMKYAMQVAEDFELRSKPAQEKLKEDTAKWDINKDILANQKTQSDIDTDKKQDMVNVAYDKELKTLDSMQADIDFNTSKKVIMEETRKDNIRMKAASEYAEYLKYISAGKGYPGAHHFRNIVGLVEAIDDGITNPDNKYEMTYKGDRVTDPHTGENCYWKTETADPADDVGIITDIPTTDSQSTIKDSNGNDKVVDNPEAYYDYDVKIDK